jgi:MFS family permease
VERARTLAAVSVFWAGLGVIGTGFSAVVVPQRLAGLTDPAHTATLIGVVSFIALAIGTAVQPIAGAVSDAFHTRWGRSGLLLIGVVAAIPALALFAFVPSVVGVLVAFILLQVAVSIAQAAQQGLIPDLVERDWRGRAAGLKGFVELGGAVLGLSMLGALLARGDPTPAVIAAGLLLIVSGVLAIGLLRERRLGDFTVPIRSLRSAFAVDRTRHATFIRVVTIRFVFLCGAFAIGRSLLLLIAERLHLDPPTAAGETAAILAVLTVAGALAALPGGWAADRFGRPRTMLAGATLASLGAVLLIPAHAVPEIVLFGALLSAGTAAFVASNWAMTTDLVPVSAAARYMGLANIATGGAAAAASLVGPPVDVVRSALPGVGYAPVLVTATLLFASSAVLMKPLLGRAVVGPEPMRRPMSVKEVSGT